MNHPDEAPKLNPIPFILAVIVLIATALLIAYDSPHPLSTFPLIAITACVCTSAVLWCLPIVLNYTRRRDALLDERQDQLVAITQTAAAAANQLSIAASNLHDIAENTTRMLKHADTLPARIQEKIGEFKIQLNEVAIAENEALEQEINTLRASETERLETALASIKKFADDIARKLSQFPVELDTAAKTLATQLSAQITTALATARHDLDQALGESLEHRNKESLARLNSEIASIETAIKTRLEQWLAEHPSPTPLTPHAPTPATVEEPPDTTPAQPPAHIAKTRPKNTPKPDGTTEANTDDEFPAANTAPPIKKTPRHPPASPRIHEKTRPEKPANALPSEPSPDPANADPAQPEPADSGPTPPEEKRPKPTEIPTELSAPAETTDPKSEPLPAPPPPPEPPPASEPPKADELPPSSGGKKTAAPVLPPEPPPPAEPPKSVEPLPPPPPSPPPSQTPPSPTLPSPPAPPPLPPRKRAPKPKPPRDEEPLLDLDLPPPSDEYSQNEPDDGGFSSAMSADGVTRLIVTAYIGIGNKLFIRGDGPGLSWDKGVPLQFVSIGKWRWETHAAAAPVSFKLYKNDTVECTRIGSPKLEPGHQHEVTANF